MTADLVAQPAAHAAGDPHAHTGHSLAWQAAGHSLRQRPGVHQRGYRGLGHVVGHSL